MTTIAVDSNLVMASDSQGTIGDRRVQEPLTKIFNVKNHIVGIAGRYSEAMVFISALEDALEREELQRSTFIPIEGAFIEEMEGFNALVITPKGEVLEYEGSRLYTVAKPPVAIGSGDKYAVAAMACGKSAEEAVEIAIKFDVYSGGDVVSMAMQEADPEPTREELQKLTKAELLDYLFEDEVVPPTED